MTSSSAERSLAIALVGYGRMGKECERVALARGHRIVSRIHPTAADPADRTVTAESLRGAEVALELLTRPDSAIANIEALAAAGCRHLVVGTTGWKERIGEVERLVAARGIALVHADNFSLGMALFTRIVAAAAELCGGRGYDPYLLEWHHRGKRDAPSGTARVLAAALEKALPGVTRHEGEVREGIPAGTFQVAAVRAGAIPGTHQVGFESEADTIELKHVARGRGGFALGAVLAAEWLPGRSGVYTFSQVLELT